MGGNVRAPDLHADRDVAAPAAVALAADVEIRSDADVERLVALAQRLLERNAQLERALASRVVIEQAKGVLAERLGVGPEAAFEVLRRAARNHRMRIHELAEAVVTEPETPRAIAELLAS